MLRLYNLKGEKDKIEVLKLTCVHSEPNYGLLWFYFKDNLLENAM